MLKLLPGHFTYLEMGDQIAGHFLYSDLHTCHHVDYCVTHSHVSITGFRQVVMFYRPTSLLPTDLTEEGVGSGREGVGATRRTAGGEGREGGGVAEEGVGGGEMTERDHLKEGQWNEHHFRV